ncbi:MAG: hypothetical protein KBS84_07040 [Treponema sp.]|nr:hypothetical protein [Candidatus Treponema scatequi]
MVNKSFKFIRAILISLALIIIGANCFAQTYYVTEDEKGNQTLFQTFSWEQDDNVFKYEFIMEHLVKGKYVEIEHKELKENSIDLSLVNGTYRYKLLAYNYLGFLEVETDWIPVEIVKAYQPKIFDVAPGTIFLEEEQDGIYNVTGSELSSTTEYSLSKNMKNQDGRLKAEILEYDDKHKNKAKIKFDPEKLDVGKWTLVAKNIGGLRDFNQDVVVKWRKAVDLDVSLGYAPIFFISTPEIKKYFEKEDMWFVPEVRVNFFPVKKRFGYFGVGLSGCFSGMDYKPDQYQLNTFFFTGNLDFVYQRYFIPKKLCLDLHAGVGVVGFTGMQFSFPHNIHSEALTSINLSVNAGLALDYYFMKRLYGELGCDFTYAFMKDMQLMFIQPQLSVGWQF